AYRWWFVESGLMNSWQNVYPVSSANGNAVARELDNWRIWFVSELRDYLLATVYVTLTFFIRVTILVLSMPLFIMVLIVGMVEGFN
ncbi:DUF4400 domain-containing protein, partial [Escherichia coli]|uniref:DUF4400 domain-containing protein n=1 Tax=Escherichia coli TaxID=562 RepID=UPI00289FAB82